MSRTVRPPLRGGGRAERPDQTDETEIVVFITGFSVPPRSGMVWDGQGGAKYDIGVARRDGLLDGVAVGGRMQTVPAGISSARVVAESDLDALAAAVRGCGADSLPLDPAWNA
jgi:hypothetical protein